MCFLYSTNLLQVREIHDRSKPHCFELYASGGADIIKACKTDSEGKVRIFILILLVFVLLQISTEKGIHPKFRLLKIKQKFIFPSVTYKSSKKITRMGKSVREWISTDFSCCA